MINIKINYIWFISLIVMDNFLYYSNVLLYISKTKKKFSLTFSHLSLAIKNVERFSLAVSYFHSFILSLCVSLFVLLCITLLQFLCVLLLMKKLKTKFSFFFLSFSAYYKLSHFFPYKDQTTFYFIF